MDNVEYFVIKKQGSRSEINHYLFNDLKIALGGIFLSKQTGLTVDVITKISKRDVFVKSTTFEKLKRFFSIFSEPIFYDLFEGLRHCNNKKELKKFGARFKEDHAILFLENANKIEREKHEKSNKSENN